ncbi:hypothetical protein PCH70_23950 [Pseudomonas cichorii JBC1]|nr:hypothetical protein PCH70_23950 [Pseudomonas cichorii JBC1]
MRLPQNIAGGRKTMTVDVWGNLDHGSQLILTGPEQQP